MRLAHALRLITESEQRPGSALRVYLVTGFESLHLKTFLHAHLTEQAVDRPVEVLSGLFDDFEGNLRRAAACSQTVVVILIEWADLDPRLGFRHATKWSSEVTDDIVNNVTGTLKRIEQAIVTGIGRDEPTVVMSPSLPLAPPFDTNNQQLVAVAQELYTGVDQLLSRLTDTGGIKVIHGGHGITMPGNSRLDLRTTFATGFPYQMTYAQELGRNLAQAIYPPAPLRGLITDLDNTMWRGIAGEDGPEAVSWQVDDRGAAHGLYQTLLQYLSENGVLVAIASRNSIETVQRVFNRKDIRFDLERAYPIESHWGNKTESVTRILDGWNIAPEHVLFIDDSQLEIESLLAAFPTLQCATFPAGDDEAIYQLVQSTYRRFQLGEKTLEDSFRMDSIRTGSDFKKQMQNAIDTQDDFLASTEPHIVVDTKVTADMARPFDLVNKTNQFNLNGVRYDASTWRSLHERADTFIWAIDYQDKFGPLGIISILGGTIQGDDCVLDLWVLSCRAFGRRIEFATLLALFQQTSVLRIRLDYRRTERNEPTRETITRLLETDIDSAGALLLTKAQFEKRCPPLHHVIESP